MITVSLTLLLLTIFILDTIFTILLTIWTIHVFDAVNKDGESLICIFSWVIFIFFNILLFFNI